MKILLHVCCADCLLKMTDLLKNEYVEITAYFYNPNIHPRSEFLARLKAVERISKNNRIRLIVADWSPKEWFKNTKFIPHPSKEKDKTRCESCWKLRLRKTFKYAKEKGFKIVSSTLMTSHYQNKEKIIEIGKDLEKELGIKFLVPQTRSSEIKTTGFYKQNYCGCCYSLAETWSEKFCQTDFS